MVSKTKTQISELIARVGTWYTEERLPQVMRHFGPQLASSKPKRLT